MEGRYLKGVVDNGGQTTEYLSYVQRSAKEDNNVIIIP